MRLLTLALLALIGGGFIAGCSKASTEDPGTLRVGMQQMPMSLDPRYATDAASSRVQQLIHRGLVRLDDHFLPRGDLAERWDHPDPLTWKFYLHQDARFQDGKPVRPEDVVATFRSILDPAMASPLRAGFATIEGIEAEGGDVVVIRLNEADASLLARLNVGILPARWAAGPQQPRETLGCGPYRLDTWSGNTLMLVRASGRGMPRIRFDGVKDPVTRVLKLVRGELDITQNDLPPHLLAYLKRQSGLHVQTRTSTTFAYIGLNLQDHILRDVRVRRALMLGLDRSKLKKALFADLPTLAETVLTPQHWAATPLVPLVFDPTVAERLLDEAGLPRGSDGVRFDLTYRTSTDPLRLDLATAIAAMWARIGVRVRIESLEWGGFYARIKTGDFQVFSLSWVGIADPDIYRWILHSSMWPPRGSNRGRYVDVTMDRWLDEAAAADTQAERQRLYARVEKKMHADLVYLPLWYEPVIAVTGTRVQGYTPASDGSFTALQDVTISQL